jgi:hypothetical protein
MQMNTPEHYIEDNNLSFAWARALDPIIRGRAKEVAPLIISVTGFENGVPVEDPRVRLALDDVLGGLNLQSCDRVANTIFPQSYWNQSAPRSELFRRYAAALPRLRRASTKNRHGLYFERMITGGPPEHPNQLDFVIKTYMARKGARRSGLQVGVFDPKVDQTAAALIGFPCLQHVTFAPVTLANKEKGLCVNAVYATQYAFERAYGNYLGLCRLGRFVAHELHVPLVRMTCFTGLMLRDGQIKATDLDRLSKAIAVAKTGGATKAA